MSKQKDAKDEKIFAMLGYLWILCFIPLIYRRNNKFAVFHARQGLIIFIISLIIFVLRAIPMIGPLIGLLGFISIGLLVITGIIQALLGNYWRIPVIGDYAEKIKL